MNPRELLLELLDTKKTEVENQKKEIEKLLSKPITGEIQGTYQYLLELLDETLKDIEKAEEWLEKS